MSKFPLYDSLFKDTSSDDLSTIQKRTFIKRVDKIDTSGYELMYILIKTYEIENNEQDKTFNLPYKSFCVDDNINFDLDNLPKKLKQILFKFAQIHIGKMKDEKK